MRWCGFQFEAQGFSFLPRQPLHSVLHGPFICSQD